MLKTMINQNNLCTIISSHTLFRNIMNKINSTAEFYDLLHGYKVFKQTKIQLNKVSNKESVPTDVIYERRKATKLILQKFNIDTNGLPSNSKLFAIPPFSLEKRIMLLQELRVPILKPCLLYTFHKGFNLSVCFFKANTLIDSNIKISENLLSYTKKSKFERINIFESDNTTVKTVYLETLAYYLKHDFDFTENELKIFLYKKYKCLWFNSFRIIRELLIFLRSDFQFSNTFIANNHWLLNSHPDKIKAIINILHTYFKDASYKIISQYPKVLDFDPHDFQKYMLHLMKFKIPTDTVTRYSKIFKMNSTGFKKKMVNLLNNPFTLIFNKHPRFLCLVEFYHLIIPRLLYLQEKNFKHATISSLTTYTSDMEELFNIKKLSKTNLFHFIKLQFDNSFENVLQDLLKHPYYSYVPLFQMYETLLYLRQHFPEKIIRKQIYSILYHKLDVQLAYETLSPKQKLLPPQQQLAFCIYSIEKKCNFTGEAVLLNLKIEENNREDLNKKRERSPI